jgi:DNA topoisomerase-1
VRLRRSNLTGNGISRQKCGRGFRYRWSNGQPVSDPDVVERIRSLVIPPAWSDVWICPWPHGHIQAVGTDAAGRRQYLYHEDWRRRQDKEKYQRAIEFAQALPALRQDVSSDLALAGLKKQRVLAAGVRLLDVGFFRIGGEVYAQEHETFGVATLRLQHITVNRHDVVFEYPAKGSIMRTLSVTDPDIRKMVLSLLRRRAGSENLLAWKDKGEWVTARSDDLNTYVKEHMGPTFSAKDFRTWAATVAAATAFARVTLETTSQRSRQRIVTAVVKEVAELLGNTPAVCRSSYIDPRVIDRFECGDTIAATLQKIDRRSAPARTQREIENAVIALLADAPAVAA